MVQLANIRENNLRFLTDKLKCIREEIMRGTLLALMVCVFGATTGEFREYLTRCLSG